MFSKNCIYGLHEINWESNPVINTPNVEFLTRSNGVKMRSEIFKSRLQKVSTRLNDFFNRSTPTWIVLLKIVQAQTLIMYKKDLYDLFKSDGRYS